MYILLVEVEEVVVVVVVVVVEVVVVVVVVVAQAPQAQCEHGSQKYKDLYGNPDKKLQKIII